MFKEGMVVKALGNEAFCNKGEVAKVTAYAVDGEIALDFGDGWEVPVCYFDFKNFEVLEKGLYE